MKNRLHPSELKHVAPDAVQDAGQQGCIDTDSTMTFINVSNSTVQCCTAEVRLYNRCTGQALHSAISEVYLRVRMNAHMCLTAP